MTRVLVMLADEQREVQVMRGGTIAVAVGLKHVSSSKLTDLCSGPVEK